MKITEGERESLYQGTLLGHIWDKISNNKEDMVINHIHVSREVKGLAYRTYNIEYYIIFPVSCVPQWIPL